MSVRKIYDISLTIHPDMHVWPGNAPVSLDTVKSISRGDSSNVSMLHIGTHSATHVDAPCHFIPGAAGVDRIAADLLIGPARLIQLIDAEYIDREQLKKKDIKDVTRLLLGTRNSALFKQSQLDMNHAYVTADAARYLVDVGVKLVGLDYLSIEQYKKEGRPTHNTLLGAGVIIVEGLDLTDVPAGDYELICMPLKLKDADGAPARVFLREL